MLAKRLPMEGYIDWGTGYADAGDATLLHGATTPYPRCPKCGNEIYQSV